MKRRTLCMLIILLLAAAPVMAEGASTQEIADRFSDVWVDDGIAVEIWYDDDFHCSAVLGDGGDESTTWHYGTCRYDPERDSLICADGVRAIEVYDEAAQALDTHTEAEGLTAEFHFMDGADALQWQDSEGMAGDFVLKRLSDAEQEDWLESQAYAGVWVCDRASIEIIDHKNGTFGATVTWGSSAFEQAEWRYECVYNGEKRQLVNYEGGVKAIVTYGEGGETVNTQTQYEDGEATFAIDDDGMLIWTDLRENAGEGMRFESASVPETRVNCLIVEGSYVIQIDVDEDDDAWQADDMTQDDSIVKLYDADILENTFVARYDPVSDGDVTVCVRHMPHGACDEVFTWDLRVQDGLVSEVLGGSHTVAPTEDELDPLICGEWRADDGVAAGMTIARNADGGWGLQIAEERPEQIVMRANVFYDCELDEFVYEEGAFYANDGGDATAAQAGDPVEQGVYGCIAMVPTGEDGIVLEWYNSLHPDEKVLFARPQG